MNKLADDAIHVHQSRRVLAFVGGQHRPELEAYLSALGGRIHSPLSIAAEKPENQDAEAAPSAVLDSWRGGVERMKVEAARAVGREKESLMSKIRYFELAIESQGKCCVQSN